MTAKKTIVRVPLEIVEKREFKMNWWMVAFWVLAACAVFENVRVVRTWHALKNYSHYGNHRATWNILEGGALDQGPNTNAVPLND